MDFVSTDHVKLWLEDGVGRVQLKDIYEIDVETVKEWMSVAVQTFGDEPRAVLLDVRDAGNIDPSAMKHLVGEESQKLTKAVAVLYNSGSNLVVAGINVILKLSREPFPVQFFTDEKKALEWIKKFV